MGFLKRLLGKTPQGDGGTDLPDEAQDGSVDPDLVEAEAFDQPIAEQPILLTQIKGQPDLADSSPHTGTIIPPQESAGSSPLEGKEMPLTPERSLPKLQIKEISKIKLNLGEIQDIFYWENYVIILPKNKKEIVVLDEMGNPLEDFKKIGDMIFPPLKLSRSVQYLTLNNYFGGRDNYYMVNRYSQSFKNIFFEPNHDTAAVTIASDKLVTINSRGDNGNWSISSVLDNKYIIVFHSKSKFYIAYRTCDDKGTPMHPRNWIKMVPTLENQLPDDLEKIIVNMQNNVDSKRKSIGKTKNVIINDTSIVIYDDVNMVFADKIDGVNNNFCLDPLNENIIYYCRSENPLEIIKVDMSGETSTWKTEAARLPNKYLKIEGLQMHPSGNYFVFNTAEGMVLINRDNLAPIHVIKELSQVSFDQEDHIRAINKNNDFVVYETNLSKIAQAVKAKRLIDQVTGIDDLFKSPIQSRQAKPLDSATVDENYKNFDEFRIKQEKLIIPLIQKCTDLTEIRKYNEDLEKLKKQLLSQLKGKEVDYIIRNIASALYLKSKELAKNRVLFILSEARAALKNNFQGDIIIASEIKQKLDKTSGASNVLDDQLKKDLKELSAQVNKACEKLFMSQGQQIIDNVNNLLKGVEEELNGMERKVDFDEWVEYRLPHLKSKLGTLQNECPLELPTVSKEIIAARQALNNLRSRYEEKFRVAYAQIRESAVEKHLETSKVLNEDLESLIERVKDHKFSNRQEAEQYVSHSPAYQQLIAEIEVFASKDPDHAADLTKKIKVQLSMLYNEVERGSSVHVSESGQQLVKFGETFFPKWEGHINKTFQQNVELIWIPEEKSKGPGVGPQDIFGNIGVRIRDKKGKILIQRLYEGETSETDWLYGNFNYRGVAVNPAYIRQKDYRLFLTCYADWQKDGQSKIKVELTKKRARLTEIYKKYRASSGPDQEKLKQEYQEVLNDYAKFCAEKNVLFLKRLDKLKNSHFESLTNGKGFVPEWSSHWVLDNQTEKYLEEMALLFKMQLDLQEGLVLLKGHAGTGKDVLIKMFCEQTHRPYFAIDCSKWTTEFELSEDIILEAEDGASRTLKVPSTVLNAIVTPGALMYFNEINAMPEQAQIFLHALMDEKRAITLKTSSGKTIKAEKTVLLAASMNPGYPGTFEPQMATRSRTISLLIDYPPLLSAIKVDNNPNPLFDSSEALRIARSVKSLADFTYDTNMNRNEFVRIWNNQINRLENGAIALTETQKFDLEVILALIQFGVKLRENFIHKFEKGVDSRKALPVVQPLTLREMRRSAYELGQISTEKKAKTNPEQLARDLLKKYFLCHIDKQEDREKIEQAMNTWTSTKRVTV